MKPWYHIVEIILLLIIAITLIITQWPTKTNNELEAPEGIVHLVQWSKTIGGNDHWYGIIDRELFWEQASAEAEQIMFNGQPGYLATITSPIENDFVKNRVITQTHQPSILDAFWLGGIKTDSGWQWVTNEGFNYNNWSLYEPNNIEDETALSIWGPSNWGDRKHPGEWNNLLPNGKINRLHRIWSVIEWGSKDMNIYQESLDTLISFVQWTKASGGNNHWYGIMALDLCFEEAKAISLTLEKNGIKGHLATISTADENSFIIDQVIKNSRRACLLDEYWLGGTFIQNNWNWVDNLDWQYENWAPGEPNNIGIETALSMWGAFSHVKGRIPGSWNNCPPSDKLNPIAHFYSIIEFDTHIQD